jgi:hypothetical protein
MKHRDRVLTALAHETPDRCPMQIGFTPEFARRLRQDPGLAGQVSNNPRSGGNTFQLERALGQDLLPTRVGWASGYNREPDVGAQGGMMLSPDCWRRFLKPRMAQFIAEVKTINPTLKVAYHSDGNIRAIIPELIEVGVDVLNPIQPACMDPAVLKQQYGDRLCFWGSLDEQHTLPFGTPEDVRREVLLRLSTVGRNGGLILGPTHHVQLDTPLENFWAMVETITDKSRDDQPEAT